MCVYCARAREHSRVPLISEIEKLIHSTRCEHTIFYEKQSIFYWSKQKSIYLMQLCILHARLFSQLAIYSITTEYIVHTQKKCRRWWLCVHDNSTFVRKIRDTCLHIIHIEFKHLLLAHFLMFYRITIEHKNKLPQSQLNGAKYAIKHSPQHHIYLKNYLSIYSIDLIILILKLRAHI